jgi:hypothetical protein
MVITIFTVLQKMDRYGRKRDVEIDEQKLGKERP